MKKIQYIIKKYHKIIFKISFMNNFTNLKIYNFLVLSSDFGCIQEKMITIYSIHYWHSTWILFWNEPINVKKFSLFQELFEIEELWIFAFFGNIFVNNGLKHFVLESLNEEFCYLSCHSLPCQTRTLLS